MSESSQELVLGNMLVLGDIEILEHWFQMNSLDDDGGSVFGQDVVDGITFSWGHFKILSSGKGGVVDGDWEHGG